jgi:hypothetical protein
MVLARTITDVAPNYCNRNANRPKKNLLASSDEEMKKEIYLQAFENRAVLYLHRDG